MPSDQDHFRQGAKNKQLSSELIGGYPDWAVTTAFYSALHIVEGMLFRCRHVYYKVTDAGRIELVKTDKINHSEEAKPFYFKGQDALHVSPHLLRKNLVRDNKDFFGADAVYAYNDLEELAHKSRYSCFLPPSQDVLDAQQALSHLVESAVRRFSDVGPMFTTSSVPAEDAAQATARTC